MFRLKFFGVLLLLVVNVGVLSSRVMVRDRVCGVKDGCGLMEWELFIGFLVFFC